MFSKRFQKQLIKEIARLVAKRSDEEEIARSVNDKIESINKKLADLKTQLGFDPELETQPAQSDSQQPSQPKDDDLTPPTFLQRKQA